MATPKQPGGNAGKGRPREVPNKATAAVRRHTSATAVPSSACRNTNAICCSLNRDFFIKRSVPAQELN
jgi:hypothetical protein